MKKINFIFILILVLLVFVPLKTVTCENNKNIILDTNLIRTRIALGEGILENYYNALSIKDYDSAWKCMDKSFYEASPKEKWLKAIKELTDEKIVEYNISKKDCIFIDGPYIGINFICHVQYETFIMVEYLMIDITDENVGIGSISMYGFSNIDKSPKHKGDIMT